MTSGPRGLCRVSQERMERWDVRVRLGDGHGRPTAYFNTRLRRMFISKRSLLCSYLTPKAKSKGKMLLISALPQNCLPSCRCSRLSTELSYCDWVATPDQLRDPSNCDWRFRHYRQKCARSLHRVWQLRRPTPLCPGRPSRTNKLAIPQPCLAISSPGSGPFGTVQCEEQR